MKVLISDKLLFIHLVSTVAKEWLCLIENTSITNTSVIMEESFLSVRISMYMLKVL